MSLPGEKTTVAAAVERLAEAFVLADIFSAEAQMEVHVLLEDVIALACADGYDDACTAAREALRNLDLLATDGKDPSEFADTLGALISVLQSMTRAPQDRQAENQAGPGPDSRAGASPQAAAEAAPPVDLASALQGDDELIGDFVVRSGEYLDAAEAGLVALEASGAEPEGVDAVFRSFHTIKGMAGFLQFPAIEALAHRAESELSDSRASRAVPPAEVIDRVLAIIDETRTLLAGVTGERGESPAGEPTDTLAQVPARSQSPEAPSGTGKAERQTVRESVRVDSERLDQLLDAIGELVIAESMVARNAELAGMASESLVRHLDQLDKITRELQEMATSLRMVTLRQTFQKMSRVVRDLAKKAGKEIVFTTSGEDTELDKSMVDQIADPLMHMVRNAVDHGLEDSAPARKKAGKPGAGRIELRAFHRGGSVFIEVEDDGRGLDREAILAKAQERGIVGGEEQLSDREVFALVMRPGFSTARKVTDISGRGVGMDVVKRTVESLSGQVEVRSEPGKGSVFSMRLPLTLAVIDGMVVGAGQERYVVPTLSIVRSVRPEPGQVVAVLGRGELLRQPEGLIRMLRLADVLAVDGAEQDPCEALVVIVESDGVQVGVMVDRLVGQQQVVIKSLSMSSSGMPGIAGASIMPDGNAGLIVDVGGLVRLADQPRKCRGRPSEVEAPTAAG